MRLIIWLLVSAFAFLTIIAAPVSATEPDHAEVCADECCDCDDCPTEEPGDCEDCATCACGAAPSGTLVRTLTVGSLPVVVPLDDVEPLDSLFHLSSGFPPGIFKPPRHI